MKAKNMWNDCVIVVISEFGRRNFENGSVGTDHGHGGAFFVAGGRVNGRLDAGSGLTAMPVDADIANNNTLPFQVDFRDIYREIVSGHVGVDPDEDGGMFPDPTFQPDPASLDIL